MDQVTTDVRMAEWTELIQQCQRRPEGQTARSWLSENGISEKKSASERAIRPFCVGKKNWVLINSEKGARASARAYSIAETAKLNDLRPYEYFKHLLTELPARMNARGAIDAIEKSSEATKYVYTRYDR